MNYTPHLLQLGYALAWIDQSSPERIIATWDTSITPCPFDSCESLITACQAVDDIIQLQAKQEAKRIAYRERTSDLFQQYFRRKEQGLDSQLAWELYIQECNKIEEDFK